jgi:hypothetical protein
MAKAAAAAPAAPAEEVEVDFQAYKEKAATDLQERFAGWIIDKLELTFGTKKEQAAFEEGVRLATALRMVFQASPENQAVLAERRASAGDRQLEAAKSVKPAAAKKAAAAAPSEPPPAQRRPAKKAATRKATAQPAPDAESETVSEPQSRPATRRPAKRRPATTTSSPEAEAPF